VLHQDKDGWVSLDELLRPLSAWCDESSRHYEHIALGVLLSGFFSQLANQEVYVLLELMLPISL